MSKTQEALKLALEALKDFLNPLHTDLMLDINRVDQKTRLAITAIREALAQPEQEPFGYFRYDLRLDAWVQNREGQPGTPFYTTPPQRKPLTIVELQKHWQVAKVLDMTDSEISFPDYVLITKDVEALHGIKE